MYITIFFFGYNPPNESAGDEREEPKKKEDSEKKRRDGEKNIPGPAGPTNNLVFQTKLLIGI